MLVELANPQKDQRSFLYING